MRLTSQMNFQDWDKNKVYECLKTFFDRCKESGRGFADKRLPKARSLQALITQLQEVLEHAEKEGVSREYEHPAEPAPALPERGGLGRKPSGITKNIPDDISRDYPPEPEAEPPKNNIGRLQAICHRLREANVDDAARANGFDVDRIIRNTSALRQMAPNEFNQLLQKGREIEVDLCHCPTDEEVQTLLQLIRDVTPRQLLTVCRTREVCRRLRNMRFSDVKSLKQDAVQEYINELDIVKASPRQPFDLPAPRRQRSAPPSPPSQSRSKEMKPDDELPEQVQTQEELRKAQKKAKKAQAKLKQTRDKLGKLRKDMGDAAKFIATDKLRDHVKQETVAKELGILTIDQSDKLLEEAKKFVPADHVPQADHKKAVEAASKKGREVGALLTACISLPLLLVLLVTTLYLLFSDRGTITPAASDSSTTSSAETESSLATAAEGVPDEIRQLMGK